MPVLENGFVRMVFDEKTGVMTHFIDKEGDLVHIAPPRKPWSLWKLAFRAGLDEQILLPPGENGSVEFSQKRKDGSEELVIQWKGLTFQNQHDAVDVSVSITLPDDSAASEWRLSVDNRSRRYGLWEADFPYMDAWPAGGEYDFAVGQSNWGRLFRGLNERLFGEYSCHSWPMQFYMYLKNGRGLYVGAHDDRQCYKRFVANPGTETTVQLPVPGAGVAGNGMTDMYPSVVQPFGGSWLEGAKIYREWALKQQWAEKGPISQRPDVPDDVKNIGLWFIGQYPAPDVAQTPEEWSKELLDTAEYYDVPIGVHVYNWHEIPFDNFYPEYFPTKPGFAEEVKKLVDAGILTMPYINARLWDDRTESFAEAEAACVKDQTGRSILEVYSPQSGQLVPMCPSTELWKNKVLEICECLIDEVGVNAIYLDQISAAQPVLCFDETHGHPVGGGEFWHQGYRDMLERMREMVAGKNRPITLTSENSGAAHIDGLDAFLIWNSRVDDEIPLMTAVYSGYTLYFSSPHPTNHGLRSFVMAQARDFIWGCQLGWMSPGMPDDFKEYFRMLGKLRVQTREFLTYGELVGELRPVSADVMNAGSCTELPEAIALDTVTAVWPWWGQIKTGTLPAVMSTVWRAENGDLGLFIVNLSEQKRAFTYAYDPARFGLDAEELTYTQITVDGAGESVRVEGGIQVKSIELDGFNAVVFKVQPV